MLWFVSLELFGKEPVFDLFLDRSVVGSALEGGGSVGTEEN